ncbi:hypothetical protein [Streptosporangium sp. CA-115845]|uniref:hypothetical protein n=1 Tax=Streptosporangium sp. CA-115845 TaxID=3240071 RepID=UPI003D91754F
MSVLKYVPAMEIPELADLIWLFEDEPQGEDEDVPWPLGLQSFKLTRGAISVLFSIHPTAGDASISIYADGEEVAYLKLRHLGRLSVERERSGYEGLKLWFREDCKESVVLQTKPAIRFSWDAKPLGEW